MEILITGLKITCDIYIPTKSAGQFYFYNVEIRTRFEDTMIM